MSIQAEDQREPRSKSLFDLLEALGPIGRPPDIFARLDKADRKRVLSLVRVLTLEPKDMLFLQGDWQEGISIIQSGLIRTFYTSPAGREITLAYWEAGNFVGGPDVFGESLHMWSGMAVRASKVLALKGRDVRSLMADIPQFGIGVAEALVFKGKCFSSLIQMLGTRSVSERLAQLLLALLEAHGQPDELGGIAIRRQFTHEDLAHMVGASRQWVTTTLDRLQRKGVLRIRKRQIVVLRPDLLMHQYASPDLMASACELSIP